MEILCAPVEKGKVEGDEVACRGWGFSAKTVNRFDTPELYFYRPQGVFVYGVDKFSPAGRAGLLQGDIICRINDREIKSLDDLLAAYNAAAGSAGEQRRSGISIMRNGVTLQLALYFNDRNDEVL